MAVSRRGFLQALTALATAAAIPASLKLEAEPILEALVRARSEEGYLFLIRKEDFKALWASLYCTQRFGIDGGFQNILVRGVPVVFLQASDKLLGERRFGLITKERFLQIGEAE